MRKLMDFAGALLFFAAVGAMGLATLFVFGTAINAWALDPEAVPWAWAIATAAALAAMVFGARSLHAWLSSLILRSLSRTRDRVRG